MRAGSRRSDFDLNVIGEVHEPKLHPLKINEVMSFGNEVSNQRLFSNGKTVTMILPLLRFKLTEHHDALAGFRVPNVRQQFVIIKLCLDTTA
jgi:hypothetical protein